jgi:hypothetical protein
MKPEKQELIHDLLDGDNCRDATLLAGVAVLRRRRHRRTAWRVLALVAVAGLALSLVEQMSERRASAPIATSKTAPPAPLRAKSLTDDQLLGLFPNTPVGLATLPSGKKLLLFPRPGDEARLVIKL